LSFTRGLAYALLLALLACSESAQRVDTTWHNQRDYSLVLSTLAGEAVLAVEVTYQGKKPQGAFTPTHDHDTDYYAVHLTNLCDDVIEFKRIEYYLERGALKSRREKNAFGIEQTYGQTSLIPGETVLRQNARVWALKDNTLHRELHLQVRDQRLTVDIPLVYQR